jgi:hypothetical protein
MLAVLGVGPRAPATKRGLSGVVLVAGGAGEPGRGEVHLARQIGHAVVFLRNGRGTEGVGLDQVGAGGEVAIVDVADHVGAREAEQLVVALHVAAKILEAVASAVRAAASLRTALRELVALDHGAHGAVEHEDALREDGGQRLAAGIGNRFHAPIVGKHRRTPRVPRTLPRGQRRQGLASTPMR